MHFHKLWIDSYTIAPKEYYRADTINKAKNFIIYNELNNIAIVEISVASFEIEYNRQADGGTIAEFLQWLENTQRQYNVKFH